LNDAKYGYDIKGSTMRLSLLRSPKWPDPTADRGRHRIAYALYPHRGRVLSSMTVRRGYEFNNPLETILTDRHAGTLPAPLSFAHLDPPDLVLTSIKKAEDSDAWIVQWYDAGGNGANAVLQLPRPPVRAVLSNFLEHDGTALPVQGKNLVLQTKPKSVVTVKVHFAR
jgi:alpha-mannosidase